MRISRKTSLRDLFELNLALWQVTKLTGGVNRIPKFIQRIFPNMIWGHPNTSNGPVYLTFDDGPDEVNTLKILDILDKHAVKGTFFLLGEKLVANVAITHEIVERGHAIGYHGLTHKAWWFLMSAQRRTEMDPKFLALEKNPFCETAGYPLLLRPPYGRYDFATLATAHDLEAAIIQWRIVVGDWIRGKSVDSIVSSLLKSVIPGDIVVLHDGGQNGLLLPEVLDQVLPIWKMKGMEIGHIPELLKKV